MTSGEAGRWTCPTGIHLLNGLYDARDDGQPVLAIAGHTFHDLIGLSGRRRLSEKQAEPALTDRCAAALLTRQGAVYSAAMLRQFDLRRRRAGAGLAHGCQPGTS